MFPVWCASAEATEVTYVREEKVYIYTYMLLSTTIKVEPLYLFTSFQVIAWQPAEKWFQFVTVVTSPLMWIRLDKFKDKVLAPKILGRPPGPELSNEGHIVTRTASRPHTMQYLGLRGT